MEDEEDEEERQGDGEVQRLRARPDWRPLFPRRSASSFSARLFFEVKLLPAGKITAVAAEKKKKAHIYHLPSEGSRIRGA